MIEIKNISRDPPYRLLAEIYKKAIRVGQKNIEAICISSYCKTSNQVDSRFVNLKYIIENEFIFFSNYKSPKSDQFFSHNQISAIFFWNSINFQIRVKGHIKKTSKQFNNNYFRTRLREKNALAISSNQSSKIDSYEAVKRKYNDVLSSNNLDKCPESWGGFSFKPYEFEFWEGKEFRLNKRDLYKKVNDEWVHSILEP